MTKDTVNITLRARSSMRIMYSSFKFSFRCTMCKTIVGLVKSHFNDSRENLETVLYSHCFNMRTKDDLCKTLVHDHLHTVFYLLRQEVAIQTICVHFLNLCEGNLSPFELASVSYLHYFFMYYAFSWVRRILNIPLWIRTLGRTST